MRCGARSGWRKLLIDLRSFLSLAPIVGSYYSTEVRVIARGTLRRFVENRVARPLRAVVKAQLDAWYAEVSRADWKNSAELKRQYRSASIVSSERVVFNIKGNAYRLVTAINYHYRVLLILWVGTHTEYDEIDVATVKYDEGRYGNLSNSDEE